MPTPQQHFKKRFNSPAFKKTLREFAAQEIKALLPKKIGQVIDIKTFRRIANEVDLDLVNTSFLAELLTNELSRISQHLRKKNISLEKLVKEGGLSKIDDLISDFTFSSETEELLIEVMQTDFVKMLFIDVIHLTIMAFNKKVNPFFGSLASKTLTKQIKAFIGIFIPAVQDKATEFVIAKENQELFVTFLSTVLRILAKRPLSIYLDQIPPNLKTKMIKTLQKEFEKKGLQKEIKTLALKLFDHFYTTMNKKKFSDVIQMPAKKIPTFANHIVDIVLPYFKNTATIQFWANEYELAQKAIK